MSIRGIPLKAAVFILEAGDFAKELGYYIHSLTKCAGSLREDSTLHFVGLDTSSLKNYHNKISSLPASSPYYSIMGSDDVEARHKMSKLIIEPCMSFKHYSATIADSAILKAGSTVLPGVVIGPEVVFGQHVLCKTNSTIGAGVQIGECSVVGQNTSIGANTKIGDRVHIGSGAVIEENLLIGSGVKIEIGEIVTQDKLGDTNDA